MATPDPILSAIARLEERLVERFEDWRRELLEARLERERSERADLREQALEFRRRLGELESRVQEIEGRLPR
jgi:hypothetical protein